MFENVRDNEWCLPPLDDDLYTKLISLEFAFCTTTSNFVRITERPRPFRISTRNQNLWGLLLYMYCRSSTGNQIPIAAPLSYH